MTVQLKSEELITNWKAYTTNSESKAISPSSIGKAEKYLGSALEFSQLRSNCDTKSSSPFEKAAKMSALFNSQPFKRSDELLPFNRDVGPQWDFNCTVQVDEELYADTETSLLESDNDSFQRSSENRTSEIKSLVSDISRRCDLMCDLKALGRISFNPAVLEVLRSTNSK